MIYPYIVYLKNERGKYINILSLLLSVISVIFFLRHQISLGWHVNIYLISSLLIVAGLVWNWYHVFKRSRPVHYSRILLVAGVTWLAMPFLQWVSIVLIILSLLEKQAKQPLEIGFNSNKVVFNTIIRRKFYWNQFNNIVLKDGILTLDFKNNKLFQKLTIDEEGDADEEEFNEYCRKHLMMSNHV